jgi:hypothetical protein
VRFDLSDGPTHVFGNQRFRITGGFLQMGQGGGNTGVAEGDANTRGAEFFGPLPPSSRAMLFQRFWSRSSGPFRDHGSGST